MADAWQPYIDDQLLSTGVIDNAAICGAGEGEGIWAKSAHFPLTANDIQTIKNLFKIEDNDVFAKGIALENKVKYIAIKVDSGRSIYGKKGKAGIIIVKTPKTVLVALHPETVELNTASPKVEALADYLISVGF